MGSIDKACISGFLCRLCSEMHRTVIHIYGDQGQRLCLVEKINGYLPITISPTDPLPKTICQTCLRRVEQHYDLLMRLSRIKEEKFLRTQRRKILIPQQNIEDLPYVLSDDDDIDHNREGQLGNHPIRSNFVEVATALVSGTSNVSIEDLLSSGEEDVYNSEDPFGIRHVRTLQPLILTRPRISPLAAESMQSSRMPSQSNADEITD